MHVCMICMHVQVCVCYACMYACIRVCMYVCTYTCICACTQACILLCRRFHLCTLAHSKVCLHFISFPRMHARKHVHTLKRWKPLRSTSTVTDEPSGPMVRFLTYKCQNNRHHKSGLGLSRVSEQGRCLSAQIGRAVQQYWM